MFPSLSKFLQIYGIAIEKHIILMFFCGIVVKIIH